MNNVLKVIREEAGMTQEELARKSKVSKTMISELESGKANVVTNIILEKLATALNKKVTDIFFIDEVQHVVHE